MSDSAEPLLVVRRVSKSFPGVLALADVDLEVRGGEVNALLGENGAGKSTLIKIMSGIYVPDRGTITVNRIPLVANPAAAHLAGVATIHQEHHLVPSMTVAENILLGRWPTRHGVISRTEQRRRALSALSRVAPEIQPSTLARRLSPADGQLVEIARAISQDLRVLIMDEPTTSLSPPEIDRLFEIVAELKANNVGIVFVSHWLDEVFRIADRITVLRDGRLVGTRPAGSLDHDGVIRMMVGREVRDQRAAPRPVGDTVLCVRGLTRRGQVENASFEVRAGEIVAIAGLVGAGRSELANCIFGVDTYESGEVTVEGKSITRASPSASIRAGIGYVPEDRRAQALVPQLSVATNLSLAVLDRLASFGWLSLSREREIVAEQSRALGVKMASPAVRISTLSGGNQQKVVIGRWLARKPRVLILDEPTKGIDVGAKAEITNLIVKLAERGVAVLLISSELPEVLSLGDRVLVMRSGRLVGELTRDAMSAEAVMSLATVGQKETVDAV